MSRAFGVISGTGFGAASVGPPAPPFRRDVVAITHPRDPWQPLLSFGLRRLGQAEITRDYIVVSEHTLPWSVVLMVKRPRPRMSANSSPGNSEGCQFSSILALMISPALGTSK